MSNISNYRANQAATAGHKAAQAGKRRDTNNRPRGTFYYDAWCDGYDSVANLWDDEKRYRLCV